MVLLISLFGTKIKETRLFAARNVQLLCILEHPRQASNVLMGHQLVHRVSLYDKPETHTNAHARDVFLEHQFSHSSNIADQVTIYNDPVSVPNTSRLSCVIPMTNSS